MSDLVEFKHTLASHIEQNKIIDEITQIISQIPNFINLRMDPEVTVYVCNVIEQKIKGEHKKNVSKINLATLILTKIWNLEENELDIVTKQIKFLDNNGAIKKVSKSKKYKKYIKDWLVKKLL
jgi:hypothetical protein